MVFVTTTLIEKKSQELEKLFQTAKCFVITPEIEEKLSQTKSPQGIFAICGKLDKSITLDTMYLRGKYIMLVNLQDAGNVGTIIRTAEAVGIDGVILTKKTCDIFNSKVIRGSMGSVFRMKTLIVDDEFKTIKSLTENGVKTYASVVDNEDDNNIVDLSNVGFENPCVLLIGNEGNGLSASLSDKCTNKVTIKMNGNVESLNASMAACILMWEMVK